MVRARFRLTGRQKLLLAVAAVLGVFVLPLDRVPFPQSIQEQERQLRRLQKRLAAIEAEQSAMNQEVAKLREKAAPFWQVQGKTPPVVEVPAAFAKLAQQAQVKVQQVGAPMANKMLDLTHVREVEFSVQVNGSMREIGRLLAQVEQSTQKLLWKNVTIRPDNPTSPKMVLLNGRIRALVLSPEATRFLSGAVEHEG